MTGKINERKRNAGRRSVSCPARKRRAGRATERRLAPPSACGRARLPAFHYGACGSEPTPPLSSRRTSWDAAKRRALPAPACPSPAAKPQTGRDAGRAYHRNRPGARVTTPPAGTVLAPLRQRHPAASFQGEMIRWVTVTVTDVKGLSRNM
jgi:hypothetical protein